LPQIRKITGPSRSTMASVTLLLLILCQAHPVSAAEPIPSHIPKEFVDLQVAITSIDLDVRYFSSDNFIGEPIDGYGAAKVYLSLPAAAALKLVQSDLTGRGLGLRVFDGYRPQRAVDHFVRWAHDLTDTTMKPRYYPRVAKENLFRDGYIAARSGHSRGSTVDVSVVSLESGEELDMGTPWDFFDLRSWPNSEDVSLSQRANRELLRSVMMKHDFRPIEEEWWHFTFQPELFPSTYFDFEIK